MDRVAKVFVSGKDQQQVSKKYHVIEPYDAFLVIKAAASDIQSLRKKYPVQDITDSYAINTPQGPVQTSALERRVRQSKIALGATSILKSGQHHYLVQFIGPIKQEWLRAVEKHGGALRVPQNDFTWVVRADQKAINKIQGLPFVRWTGHLPYRDRISPGILRKPQRTADDTSSVLPRTRIMAGTYVVEFFGQKELAAAVAKIRRLKFKILSIDKRANLLTIAASDLDRKRGKSMDEISAIHGVRFIRERVIKRSSNDVATGLICSDSVRNSKGLGLNGEGEVVGICDTGIDTGNTAAINRDFSGRIAAIKSYPITPDFTDEVDNPGADDGPADMDSGHGTHVAGSVLGDGTNSAAIAGQKVPIRGLAYKAKLVFQAVEQRMDWKSAFHGHERYILSGIPADITDVFHYAYKKRARIHSNSWGGGEPGEYDQQCSQLDDFVWKYKDFCIVVASGNDGSDNDGNGKINPMSVTSPGTAKNCITVGACENLRPQFVHEVYGDWWPDDYPVSPFLDDPMADDPNEVVAFSSRGPTADGRIKPDVIAPGTFILSTRSSQIASNNTAWAAFPKSKLYFYMGGTSMATPLVSGATALVRQYYRQRRNLKKPTAALLKATLVAGATRIGSKASKKLVCDNAQGFGRVNLGAVLAPGKPKSMRFVDRPVGLQTGQARDLNIAVKSNKYPLKVVLAYTDAPGPALVNDLNLFVEGPGGVRYVGNQTKSGSTNLDSRNNIEVVNIEKPRTGTWNIKVVASNVPNGPQDYALVYVGAF